LAGPAYRGLAAVWAQTEADAARLRALGAAVKGVTGNLKFDATPNAIQLAQGHAWRAASPRPVLMFASSREGEEAMLLEALARRTAAGQKLEVQWLIVPRHPQRFDEVAALLQAAGLTVSRRSSWGSAPLGAEAGTDRAATPALTPVADVWLGDSLGEMALYFGLADAALLGGSFAPLGGQNLIEAAACGCPVLMGPHTFNFAQAAEMAVEAGAAFRCADLADAVGQAQQLLGDAQALQQARESALAWSQAHRGATARTLSALSAYLG
jgi:3-deoxy-D-manno-octulosonic-acid transferase